MVVEKFERFGLMFRPVEVSDAHFILELRTDEKLGRFISKTDQDIAKQIEWITQYKQRENAGVEFYYVTEDKSGTSMGLYRLYNFDGDTFEGGSWLYRKCIAPNAPILGDFAIRDIAFEQLNFEFCNLLVMRLNKPVLQYHMSFNPMIVKEDESFIYLKLSRQNYRIRRDKLIKMLFQKKEFE
jgi:hypothetical protein